MSVSVVYSSVDHDRIELWLDKHYLEIINYLRPIIDKRYPTFKNSNIIRSKLLLERTFSGKTIDALIQLEFDYAGKQKASYDMTIVLDIKPKLERISELLNPPTCYRINPLEVLKFFQHLIVKVCDFGHL